MAYRLRAPDLNVGVSDQQSVSSRHKVFKHLTMMLRPSQMTLSRWSRVLCNVRKIHANCTYRKGVRPGVLRPNVIQLLSTQNFLSMTFFPLIKTGLPTKCPHDFENQLQAI